MNSTIIWRRLDEPGHEAARLVRQLNSWQLEGAAVFLYERQPCRLEYRILCNTEWRTETGSVHGWLGNELVKIDLAADARRRWFLNGKEIVGVAGSIDLDLNFSPVTNLLPIRRLNLEIGQEAEVTAAWLRFPDFTLEPLEQRYRRIAERVYHYESAGGKFIRELHVNAAGLVTHYPDFWQIEG